MIVTEACRTDEALALRAARGDREAFEELVRLHTPGLLSFCRRFSRDRAEDEDRVQETFIKAHRNLSTFDPSRSFVSWLTKIAQNACLDGVRSRERPLPLSRKDHPPIPSDDRGQLDEKIGFKISRAPSLRGREGALTLGEENFRGCPLSAIRRAESEQRRQHLL